MEAGNVEADNFGLQFNYLSTNGVVEISDEAEQNLYCELMQDYVAITGSTEKSSLYNSVVGESSTNCRPKINRRIINPHTTPELIQLIDDDNIIYKKKPPKFRVESLKSLMVSKNDENSVTVFYDMGEEKYSIGLESDALDGLNPRQWVTENLLDVLLIRILIRSERKDISYFERISSI